MRISIVLIVLVALVSCESKVSSNIEDPAFGWGYLPALESDYYQMNRKCSHKTYARNFYSAINEVESLYIQGARVSGISHPFLLGDSCVQATISTRVYISESLRDKSYYSIGVQVPVKDSRCTVDEPPIACDSRSNSFVKVFSKDFTRDEVGSYFKGRKMSDVISYEEGNKEVIFSVNSKEFKYVLPSL